MRTARKLALLILLVFALTYVGKSPVEAGDGCEEACAYDYSVCYANAYDEYHSCLDNCDSLYPWWGGCTTYCFEARQGAEAACDNNYTSCLANCQ
jgi:hypothetical protein